MGGGLGRVTNHQDYYLSDGSVSFLTGGTLFKVHRSFFERESEVFRDLFARAAEEDPQSGTDARPFTLDVKPDEFEQLLWVWYGRDYSYRQQTKTNWITILRLSNRWEFPKIKELAIRELDALGLPPAERIAIYNEHGVDDDRLLNSYVEICKSPTVPTQEEGDLLDMETLINVLQAREDAQRKAFKLRQESPTSAGLEDETLREIVSSFFKTGLNPRSNGATTGSGVQASNLNGEHSQGTSADPTITLGAPQVPDRKAGSSEPSSLRNSSLQTCDKREEKEKLEKARQAKEQEEKEKEKAKQAKEKAERERTEREKQEKEKEAKEKGKKLEDQKPPANRRTGGR